MFGSRSRLKTCTLLVWVFLSPACWTMYGYYREKLLVNHMLVTCFHFIYFFRGSFKDQQALTSSPPPLKTRQPSGHLNRWRLVFHIPALSHPPPCQNCVQMPHTGNMNNSLCDQRLLRKVQQMTTSHHNYLYCFW